MASKKFEKNSEEWQFFQDYWKFRQQYYEADDDDAFFEQLIAKSTEFYKKYEGTSVAEYAKKLVIAHLDDVDRRYRLSIGKKQ